MSSVKWIRICTDMINNKKIKRIRTMPEGNNIVLIWVFLIAQAGESNRNGGLFLTDTIPFTHEDLAVEFGFEIPVVQLALITLEKFAMIEVYDDVIYIKNWEEYQNSDGLEKIREQGRERAKRFREKQKQALLIEDSNVTDNVTVTQDNATEQELEKELEKELDKDLCEKVVESFNAITADLPKVKSITEKRKSLIKARMKEHGFDSIIEAFKLVQESDFLSCRSGGDWSANFDWVMKKENFTKIIEGNYKNKDGKVSNGKTGNQFLDRVMEDMKNEQTRNNESISNDQSCLPGLLQGEYEWQY